MTLATAPKHGAEPTRQRILVVEDDPQAGALLMRATTEWGFRSTHATTLAEALERLAEQPDLVLLDVHLPDGSAVEFARVACERRPAPTLIAVTGAATGEEAFELARLGTSWYLSKPFSLDDLQSAIESALRFPTPFEPQVVRNVGLTPLREVQERVRRAMLDQALARTGGNRSAAGRLLGVSRQAIQQMIGQERSEDDEPEDEDEV